MSLNGDETLIPYGAANWPIEQLAEVRATRAAGLPLAVVRAGVMLRINGGALDLPPSAPPEADTPMTARVAAHLKRLYGGWNATAGRFLDQYFAFLARQIDCHRVEIEARLAPLGGLFRAEDFIYSAPLPLPHAFLVALAQPASQVAADPADFVRTDFAWWLGARTVAVLLAPSPLTPAATRRQKERLATAGIEAADCTMADLGDPEFAWFTRILGPDGSRFWEDEALPSAPCPPVLPNF
jgi:hypothetical protein